MVLREVKATVVWSIFDQGRAGLSSDGKLIVADTTKTKFDGITFAALRRGVLVRADCEPAEHTYWATRIYPAA